MNKEIKINAAKIVQALVNDQTIYDDAKKYAIEKHPEVTVSHFMMTEEEYAASAEHALYNAALAEYLTKVLAEAISRLMQ